MKRTIPFLISLAGICFTACQPAADKAALDTSRIVSLDGTVTEILCELGFEKNIVGVDVTSNYPAAMNALPKAGHNRNVNAEAVIAMQPTVIVALEKALKPEVAEQFKTAGIRVLQLPREYSFEGTKQLITALADTLGKKENAAAIHQRMDADLAALPVYDTVNKPKVLFIYARGAGAMSVAGTATAPNTMIKMAGGINAASEIEGFKPFTPEAVVKENPDVILFFDTGLESLGGAEGLLKVPGIANTNAGRNKKFMAMEGQYLAGLSPRMGKAVVDLAALIHGDGPAKQ